MYFKKWLKKTLGQAESWFLCSLVETPWAPLNSTSWSSFWFSSASVWDWALLTFFTKSVVMCCPLLSQAPSATITMFNLEPRDRVWTITNTLWLHSDGGVACALGSVSQGTRAWATELCSLWNLFIAKWLHLPMVHIGKWFKQGTLQYKGLIGLLVVLKKVDEGCGIQSLKCCHG